MPHPLRSFNIPQGAQYGARRLSGTGHKGCDYHPKSNGDGDPIFGTLEGGRVMGKGYGPSPVNGYGHWVTVAYPGGVTTLSAHMREASPLATGAQVTPATIIGHVGHTGNAVIADPPGSHVHHELRVNGVLRDPYAYYGGSSAAGSAGIPIAPEPEQEEDEVTIYLVQRVADGHPTLNGMECALAPGYFRALGKGDLAGVARDLKIADEKIVRGSDGKGLHAIEFDRLISLFGIAPGYVHPGGAFPPLV